MTEWRSETIGAVMAALSKAQSQIAVAHKDKKNTFYRSTYADLESVWDAFRGPMTENELSLSQLVLRTETGTVLRSVLGHASGEFLVSDYPIHPAPKPVKDQAGNVIEWIQNDPQEIGKAVTYARRYSAMGIFGVCPSDDDGNEASKAHADAARQRASASKPTTAPPTAEDAKPPAKGEPAAKPITAQQKGRLLAAVKAKYPDAPEELLAWAIQRKYFPAENRVAFSWKKVTEDMARDMFAAFTDEERTAKAITFYERALAGEPK